MIKVANVDVVKVNEVKLLDVRVTPVADHVTVSSS